MTRGVADRVKARPRRHWFAVTLGRIRAGLRWFVNAQRFGNSIALVTLGVTVMPLLQQDTQSVANPPPSSLSPPSHPHATGAIVSPASRSYLAKIVNTYSDEQRRFTGVRAAISPYASGHAGVGYLEGEQVTVLCQVPDGRLVEDEVSGRVLSSTVWYRTAQGVWIPSIYADLPGAGPQVPPHC